MESFLSSNLCKVSNGTVGQQLLRFGLFLRKILLTCWHRYGQLQELQRRAVRTRLSVVSRAFLGVYV